MCDTENLAMKLVLLGSGTPSTQALDEAARALGAEVLRASGVDDLGALAARGRADGIVVDLDAQGVEFDDAVERVRRVSHAGAAAVGSNLDRGQVKRLFAAGARDVIATPVHQRELVLRMSALLQRKRRIACIGGGTGLFSLLTGLRSAPGVLLSSIVTMSDDGGSSGRLRTTFGVLPPGDVRRSLVALSNAPQVMNYVMQYRFEGGDGLHGHSLGNLLLTALSELGGGMQGAVKAMGDILNVHGLVMCVTDRSTTLCAEFEDGSVVRGESAIDQCTGRPGTLRIRKVWQEPDAETSVDAMAALLGADLIVIGPGDLYTSVLSGLIVGGVAEAVRASGARRLYVCNLMTKPGETSGYDVADHVAAVVRTLGRDALDTVLVSSTAVPAHAAEKYAARGQHPVAASTVEKLRELTRAEVLPADVGDPAELVRHDSEKLGKSVLGVLERGARRGG
jgi:uncharacterized cofD-like protein